MSTLVDIADAVVTCLNAGTFSQAFTAERLYQPAFDLAEMDTLHVSVVPKSMTVESAARDGTFHDCAVDIGIQKKVDPEAPEQIDALMDLVEEISDHLKMRRLEGLPGVMWLSIQNEPVLAREHLEQMRQFTSVLTVVYRVKR